MISKVKITSLENQSLEPYKTLRRPVEHNDASIFVAESKKLVERLLESKLTIRSLLLTEEWFEFLKFKIENRTDNIEVFINLKSLLSEIVGFDLHQGIMAVANIPEKIELRNFVETKNPTLLVAIDGIVNSENIGIIVRNCAAFNVDGIIVGETSADPYLRRAVRNSMGTIFKLPIIYSNSLLKDISFLNEEFKIKSYAAHISVESETILNKNFQNPACLLFGNEESGPRVELLNLCEWFMIPMKDGIDSLNVANASAVALYDINRQRSTLNFK
ncbi:MAG: RNA methyltransferase [Ignavibacteria bacterium]|nr:RNA methyltransferase [Ignavibacteria bacterium]